MFKRIFIPVICVGFSSLAQADETWVTAIRTSPIWASYPCKDLLVTRVCRSAKNFTDAGTLPPVVRVGDAISYIDKEGTKRQFHVEAINFYTFEKDIFDKKVLLARKGETTCSLYDSTKALRSQDYLSKIVVKGCVALQ